VVGDTQALVSLLKAEARLYRMRTKGPITVKGLATLTANVVHGQRYFPYLVQLMMGGHDASGPSLYIIDLWGGLSEEKLASTGSGSPVAYGVLESRYRLEMSEEEGIELGIASIRTAMERDAATGNLIDVSVIDKDGYKAVERERIDGILKKVRVSPF
jgi:proteasome beta subunit